MKMSVGIFPSWFQYSLVLRVLNITVKELLDLRVEGSESLVSFCVRIVNTHVCSRWDDIELGIKNINAMYNTVEPRKGKCNVGLVLPNSVLAAKTTQQASDTHLVTATHWWPTVHKIHNLPPSDFLECTGDDEISVIHGNKVSCELAWEVILTVEFVQVYVWVGVFGFLQGVGNGTL